MLPANQDKEQHTALHWAAFKGSMPCVKLLVENGSHPGNKDRNQLTPALVARAKEYQEVAEYLERLIGL